MQRPKNKFRLRLSKAQQVRERRRGFERFHHFELFRSALAFASLFRFHPGGKINQADRGVRVSAI